MKKISKLYYIFLIAIIACSSFKIKNSQSKASFSNIAIKEFIKTNLFKTNTVYVVDSLDLDKNIIFFTIIDSEMKIIANKENVEKIPQCCEINNSLFILNWRDENFDPKRSINLLNKYNFLVDDTPENLIYLEPVIDEKSKSFDIFFCKNNPNVFKKIKTNIPFPYYNKPQLKCS